MQTVWLDDGSTLPACCSTNAVHRVGNDDPSREWCECMLRTHTTTQGKVAWSCTTCVWACYVSRLLIYVCACDVSHLLTCVCACHVSHLLTCVCSCYFSHFLTHAGAHRTQTPQKAMLACCKYFYYAHTVLSCLWHRMSSSPPFCRFP